MTAKRKASRRKATKRKATKRKATKRKATRQKATKRKAAKRVTRRRRTAKKAIRRKVLKRRPAGYRSTPAGILVPDSMHTPVPASKIRSGLATVKTEIQGVLQDIVDTMTDEYAITEVELTASFNADGKFMGFGVGGDASIKIKIAPVL